MSEYPQAMLDKMQADLLLSRIKRSLLNNKTILGACQSTYGITPRQVLDMLASQDANCAICETTFEDVRWVVDHCHKTGEVRGLLCSRCNTWLGTYELMIRSAAKYLGAK